MNEPKIELTQQSTANRSAVDMSKVFKLLSVSVKELSCFIIVMDIFISNRNYYVNNFIKKSILLVQFASVNYAVYKSTNVCGFSHVLIFVQY